MVWLVSIVNSPRLLELPHGAAAAAAADEGPKRKAVLVDDEDGRSAVKVPRWSEAVQQPAPPNVAACAVKKERRTAESELGACTTDPSCSLSHVLALLTIRRPRAAGPDRISQMIQVAACGADPPRDASWACSSKVCKVPSLPTTQSRSSLRF